MAAAPVLPILFGASAISGLLSTVNQSREAQGEARYNAAVAENNATATRQQAAANEGAMRRQRTADLGRARAAAGQSGLGSVGSVLDVYDQSAINSEMDILNQRYQSDLQARGYQQQAAMERTKASNAKRALPLQIGASLLSSVGGYYAASSAAAGNAAKVKAASGGL